jgi:hypothetical protein
VKKRFPRNDHNFEIFRRLAAHQAVHRQQACDLLDRHPAIGIRHYAESHRT